MCSGSIVHRFSPSHDYNHACIIKWWSACPSGHLYINKFSLNNIINSQTEQLNKKEKYSSIDLLGGSLSKWGLPQLK